MRHAIGPMLALVALFTGALAARGAAPKPELLYIHDYGGTHNQVWAYSVQSTGALAPVSGSPFQTTDPGTECGGECDTIAYAAGPHELFVGGRNGISAFQVAADGSLALVNGSPFGGERITGVGAVTLGTSTYVYGCSYETSQVYGYAVQANGSLVSVPGGPFYTGDGPDGLVAVKNKVFAASENDEAIAAFTVQSNGSLTAAPGSPYSSDAGYFYNCSVDPTGKFLYVADDDDTRVYGYKINNRNAALTSIHGSPFVASTGGDTGFVVAGKSKITYAVHGGSHSPNIQAYQRQGSGALKKLGSAFNSGFAYVDTAAMDAPGKLVAMATSDGTLKVYTINTRTGGLTPVENRTENFEEIDGMMFVTR